MFGRHDAVNILKKNLANIVSSLSKDHMSWLPENDRNIERIIYEKTSSLLNSNIIVAKQSSDEIVDCIKKPSTNLQTKYFSTRTIILYQKKMIFFISRINSVVLKYPNQT